MQKVSKAYKESMKSSLRERAYIMLSFGLINQEAQAKATVEDGDFAYYENAKNVLGEKSDDTVYATLEENFTRVDGSMFFLPRENQSGAYPVSYTHLDVYKRQGLHAGIYPQNGCGDGEKGLYRFRHHR